MRSVQWTLRYFECAEVSKDPPFSRGTTRAMDELSAERQEHVHELEWKLHEATEGTRSELARLRSELVRTRRQLELSEMDRNQIAADLDLLAQGMTSLCERCVTLHAQSPL